MSEEPVVAEGQADEITKTEAIKRIKEMQAQLKRQEELNGPSGALSNEPTALILDASGISAAHPDKRFRWVSVTKAQRRKVQGYERVPEAEGGRQVGNLILMCISREKYDAANEEIRKRNRDRLNAHNVEMEQAAEAMAKTLRAKGLRVKAEDLLVEG